MSKRRTVPVKRRSASAKPKVKAKPDGRANPKPRVSVKAQPASRPVAATNGAPITLHLLSDSTGNLPNHMLGAFLTQFPRGTLRVKLTTFLNTSDKLRAAVAAISSGVVFHALVSDDFKAIVRSHCEENRLPCCDLTGDFIEFIARSTGVRPTADVGALHEVSDQYQSRIDALEFTLAHDDGLGLETLHEADVVLAGISRTSKTPTSILLGQQGYRVGNVALAIQVPPPSQLLALPKEKVIGLLVDPIRLQEVRQSRGKEWRMGEDDYVDIEHIQREVLWSRKLFNSMGWRTLDVTASAIEETAARIVTLAKLRPVAHAG